MPLRDWDEGIVAQVAREIGRSPLESLRWLYPTLFGEPYLNKPPLMHILIALSYHLGGVSEWTTRLPGALLSAISVPLLYGVGREVFLGRTAAVLSTLVYLTSLAVVRNGRLAMLDGAVLCFSLGMLLCLLRSRRDVRWSLGVGVAFGLICLTKGILGLLLGAIALGFLAWDTPRLLSTGYFWGGWLVGAIPAVGWYLAQWLHYGALFWNNNLVDQSFSRVWSAVESNAGPPWYYLLELLKYGWPWLIFLNTSGVRLILGLANNTVPNDLLPKRLNPRHAPCKFFRATTECAKTTGVLPQYKNTSRTIANSRCLNPITSNSSPYTLLSD